MKNHLSDYNQLTDRIKKDLRAQEQSAETVFLCSIILLVVLIAGLIILLTVLKS